MLNSDTEHIISLFYLENLRLFSFTLCMYFYYFILFVVEYFNLEKNFI